MLEAGVGYPLLFLLDHGAFRSLDLTFLGKLGLNHSVEANSAPVVLTLILTSQGRDFSPLIRVKLNRLLQLVSNLFLYRATLHQSLQSTSMLVGNLTAFSLCFLHLAFIELPVLCLALA